jgi:phage protein D
MAEHGGTRQLVPTFQVRLDDNELPLSAVHDLLSVAVSEDLQAPGMFTLLLQSWDTLQQRVTWADDPSFAVGAAVQIRMGYVGQLATLMDGEITGLELEHNARNVLRLTVRGYDRRHRLLRGQKTRSFTQMTDSDIAQKIAQEQGLSATVTATEERLDYVLQHNQTDLAFLRDRAWRLGYEVTLKDTTLYFRPFQHRAPEVLTLEREDLLEFSPRLSTLSQVDAVEIRGWDIQNKQAVVGRAQASGSPTPLPFALGSAVSVNRPVVSQQEADRMAQGRLDDIGLNYITGEGRSLGRTDLRAGTVVRIAGLGQRFSGLYYLTAATHTYTPGQGYYTSFRARRPAT